MASMRKNFLVHLRRSSYYVPKVPKSCGGIAMRRIAAFLLLFTSMSCLAAGQQTSRAPFTNADVIQMMKSGLGKHTIVLLIQQSPCHFDTSPQALIRMKKAGASDEVINAMVTAALDAVVPVSAEASAEGYLQKALNAVGPPEQVAKIQSVRWVGTVAETSGDKASVQEERLQVYPDRVFVSLKNSKGLTEKLIITPDFSYQSSGHLTGAISASAVGVYRQQVKFDPIYVAQHSGDYTLSPQGVDGGGNADIDHLKITLGGVDYLWEISAQTGHLLSIKYQTKSGDATREYSDYRLVDGVSFPFKWRTTESGRTTETTISKYEVNPVVDESLFQPPENLSATALTFRVLQAQSVEYAQEMDGNDAVNCQISETADAPGFSTSLDDTAFTKDLTAPNVHMICNSWDTTKFFPRTVNAMLVVATDGNAYIIACDKALRWSKCYSLKAGQVFNANRTAQGLDVQAFSARGGELEAPYSILQTKALQ
jgi:hypothetical protein